MKKKLLAILLCGCMLVSLFPATAFAVPAESWADYADASWLGDYSTTNWIIEDEDDLAAFAATVNSGNDFSGKTVTLVNDLEMSAHAWTPIGNNEAVTNRFSGTFEGNGHSISNLYYDGDSPYVGLFGYVYGATIKNVSIEDCNFRSSVIDINAHVGGVAGSSNNSTITDCSTSGSVSGNSNNSIKAGGVVGDGSNSTVTDCCNSGSVSASGSSYCNAGGVVGCDYGSTVANCSNIGSVSASGSSRNYAGGMAGNASGTTVVNCSNIGSVSASGSSYNSAGGMSGYNDNYAVFNNCFNTGSVSASGGSQNRAGGIAGYNFYDYNNKDTIAIINCYYFNISTSFGIGNNSPDTAGATTALPESQMKAGKNEIDGTDWVSITVGSTDTGKTSLVDALNIGAAKYNATNPAVPASRWERIYSENNGYPFLDSSISWADYIDTSWLGDYSSTTDWIIEDEDDLAAFAAAVNGGNDFAGKTVTLVNDLDMSAHIWTPIGMSYTLADRFRGTFDGNEKTISGLNYDGGDFLVGLFGNVQGGTVKNVNVTNCTFCNRGSPFAKTGAIAGALTIEGTQKGIISGCNVDVQISAVTDALQINLGCIAGTSNNSIITDCAGTGSISSTSVINTNSIVSIGGIVGYSYGSDIVNCSNNASVTGLESSGSTSNVGGIVGDGYSGSTEIGRVINCRNSGDVSASGGDVCCVGGVVGNMKSNSGDVKVISNCYSIGNVTAAGSATSLAGGVVGKNENAIITSCYYLDTKAYFGIGNSSLNTAGETTALPESQMTAERDSHMLESHPDWVTIIVDDATIAAGSLVFALLYGAKQYNLTNPAVRACMWTQSVGENNGYPTLAPVTITTSALSDGAVDTTYSQTLAVAPAGDGLTWTITDGALPSGLQLDESTGTISGIPTTAGVSTFTLKAENNGYDSETKQLSITVCSELEITVQPISQTIGKGDTATFTVEATGYPVPSYQWQVSTDGGSSWNDVTDGTGGDSASYTTPYCDLSMSGRQYRCYIENRLDDITTNAATLTVLPSYGMDFTLSNATWGGFLYYDFTANDAADPDGKWSWDASDKILTLNGFSFSTVAATALKVPDNTTIIVSGDNTITTNCRTDAIVITAAGTPRASIKFEGDGTLLVSEEGTDNTAGIYALKVGGDAEFSGGTFTFTTRGASTTSSSYGICAGGTITAKNCTLNALGGASTGNNSAGIICNNVLVGDEAVVYAAGEGKAIVTMEKITVVEATVTGSETPYADASALTSAKIMPLASDPDRNGVFMGANGTGNAAKTVKLVGATEVDFMTLTANGSDTALTTELTLTFNKDIAGLTVDDITVTGATKGALTKQSGTGVYKLTISDITVEENGKVNVTIEKGGFIFTHGIREVRVYMHIWEEIPAVISTCFTQGNNRYFYCSDCDKYYKEDKKTPTTVEAETLSFAEHNYGTLITETPATHFAPGMKEHYKCSVCNQFFNASKTKVTVASLEISVIPHSYGSVVSHNNGTHTKTCACGDTVTERCACVDVVTEPTCTEGGYTRHTCPLCNYSYINARTEVTGHTFGEWVDNNDGGFLTLATHSRTCTECGCVETETIPGTAEYTTIFANMGVLLKLFNEIAAIVQMIINLTK
ncbi:MAG: hypothetical protein GX051_00150 [Clostridiales bacterium]|nr:hypothetical protein [Clostridiales bacterium]